MPKLNPRRTCAKCGRDTEIHRHHILARADGGGDESENLADLCAACHHEWHTVEMLGSLSYEAWLEIPPLHQLIAAYQTEWPADCTAAQMWDTLRMAHQLARGFFGE